MDPCTSAQNDDVGDEQQEQKTAQEIEKEQEAMLKAKYGALKPKKKLIPKEHKFFDSADWALNKEAAAKSGPVQQPMPEETLKPKLEPTPVPARRVSHLDPMEKLV